MRSLDIASDFKTDPELLDKLSGDLDAEVRIAVAMNSATPSTTVRRLSKDMLPEVRRAVAKSEAPADVFTALAEDPDASVRLAVASNPRCPSDVLEILVNDDQKVFNPHGEHSSIREAVAGNPSTTPETLTQLAQEGSCVDLVARNPSTPEHVVAALTNDPMEASTKSPTQSGSADIDSLEEICNQAQEMHLAGSVPEAVALWEVASSEGSSRAQFNLACVAYSSGDIKEAKRLLTLACGAKNPFPKAFLNLSGLVHDEGDVEYAAKLAEIAAALGHPGGAFNRGQIALKANDLEGAHHWWKQAVALGDGEAALNLGITTSEQGDIQAANEWFKQSAELGCVEGMRHHANALEQAGRSDESSEWYARATAESLAAVPLETNNDALNQGSSTLTEHSGTKNIGPLHAKFCGNCGQQFGEADKFCMFCGAQRTAT